jgi:hypothetical protein
MILDLIVFQKLINIRCKQMMYNLPLNKIEYKAFIIKCINQFSTLLLILEHCGKLLKLIWFIT